MYIIPSLPCALPNRVIPEFTDLEAVAGHFRQVLEVLDENAFTEDAIWRDSFAMTGTLRTFYSAISVTEAWKETSKTHNPVRFKIAGHPHILHTPKSEWLDIGFTFETTGTPATTCSGFLSITPNEAGQWKIWMLRTILEQLVDQPNVDLMGSVQSLSENVSVKRSNGENGTDETIHINGANHPYDVNGINGTANGHRDKKDFDCVIVGGGQAGLAVGGRLKALGVSYVILEKHAEVGDNWKTRYDSTKLHTIREFAHLPFDQTFPENFPEFLTREDLATGYRQWATKYAINIWLSTKLVAGSWDSECEIWNLNLLRNGQDVSIACSYVVFATGGGSQVPVTPIYENRELFKGITLHSGTYRSASEWTGKHGIVIGTANTAHDIAEDMIAAGLASVTMVQRSKTYVVPAEHYKETQEKFYNAHIATEKADRLYFSGPAALSRLMSAMVLQGKARQEPERFDALEKAGFLLDRDGDMIYQIFERFGGHYMDVGASEKISSGQIKIKSDSLPIAWKENGMICSNGDHLKADVVVFATGFIGNLRLLVAEIFGHDVAGQMEDFWGLDEEGELKGAFKPSGHVAFWYHGGAVGQTRYFSRFIALQIKAKLLGTPLPLYDKTRREVKL